MASSSIEGGSESPEDSFTIEVEAVAPKAVSYSDVQPAEDQGTFSDQRRGRAIIQGQFHRIEHGCYKNEPAILLKLELTFRSAGKDQIVEGEAEFAFNRGTAPGKDSATGPSPALQAVAPFSRRALRAHAKHVSHGTTLDPSVDVGGFGGGTGAIFSRETRYEQARHWKVEGRRLNPRDRPRNTTASFTVDADGVQPYGVPPYVPVAMIVTHHGEPFHVAIELSGRLKGEVMHGFSTYFNRDKKAYRVFDRFESSKRKFDDLKLEEVVDGMYNGMWQVRRLCVC